MRLLFSACFLFLFLGAQANDIRLAAALIPERLTKTANMVKRYEELRYEIIDMDHAVFRSKVAYTILNEEGDRYAQLVVGYDKLRKVTLIEGNLYDAMGNLVRKAKNKDVLDFSAVQDISLFDDNRVKVIDFAYHSYPFTVEFETEVRLNNTYMIPDWTPQPGQFISVERSSYSFTAPEDYKIRYKAFNYPGEPETVSDKHSRTLTWKVSGLPGIKKPFAAPMWNEMTTKIFFAASQFEMEGYKGDGSSWEGLGRFQISLNEGRDKLTEPVLAKVRELTAGITDEREKVRVLYQFLQKNTRYISIQRGIGGLQPFEASFVAQKGYGDCKALSNYMTSLLKAAGIRSHYCWVHAGDDPDDKYLLEDFPSDQFNHIIVCVPLAKDTLWLECTSQDTPAGYMGEFTGNRKAMLVTENGGLLVSTPRYTLKENLQARTIRAELDAEGNLGMKVETTYGGTQQDALSGLINHYSKDKVQKVLQQSLELSTYDVNSFSYEETKDILPQLRENLDVSVSHYANVSGKRIFIVPNILNRGGRKMDVDTARKVDYVFYDEYRDRDDYEIRIPEGYQLEAAPPDVSIRTKFGNYTSTAKLDGNRIVYHREVERFAGRFPASSSEELAKFYNDIYKADRSRMVLVKKE